MLKHNIVPLKVCPGVLQAIFGALVITSLSCYAVANSPRLKQSGKKQTVKAKAKPIDLKGKIIFTRGKDVYAINSDGSGETRVMQSPKGYGSFAEFSPDAKRVLYANEGNVFLFNFDGMHLRPKQFPIGGGEITAQFSPDAKEAICSSVQTDKWAAMNSNIFKVDLGTGKYMPLAGNQSGSLQPFWSRDGKRLVFARSEQLITAIEGPPTSLEIYVMNADGANRTQLTHNQEWDAEPTFSRDGKRIAFVRHIYTTINNWPIHTSDIYIMNIDGSREIRLTHNIAWTTSGLWSDQLNDMPLTAHAPIFGPNGQLCFTQGAMYIIHTGLNDYRPRRLADGVARQWM